MYAAIDVDYRTDHAAAAAVVFDDVTAASAVVERVVRVDGIADYEPGAFYKRELPCALAVLQALRADGVVIDTVIVDGHVWLGPGTPGLGARLYEALLAERGIATPVIGVAKTPWHDRAAHVEVVRGGAKPLWVSAAGVDVAAAADLVRRLHGPYRLPTLLSRVDRLARDARV
jgi:deoxyribonuclease V